MLDMFNKKKALAKKFFLDYAKREIGLIGITPDNKIYDKIVKLVKTFYDQDFDPTVKPSIVYVLNQVLRCKPLTYCQHNEFRADVSAIYGGTEGSLLQCSRCLNMFSKDNGATWYDYYEKELAEDVAKNHSCGADCQCGKHKKKSGFTKFGKEK